MISFTPEQIRQLRNNELVTIAVILEDQPPKGCDYMGSFWHPPLSIIVCAEFFNSDTEKLVYIPLTHPIGSTCEVREEWAKPCTADIIEAGAMFYFKRSDITDSDSFPNWQPPDTMPDGVDFAARGGE